MQWTPDGKQIVVSTNTPVTTIDIYLVPADGSGQPTPYLATPFSEMSASVSPGGKWIAYTSNESGRKEVYVDSFPRAGTRALVSVGGAAARLGETTGANCISSARIGTS
jgi:Tol biopolymer transport system component